MLTQPEATTAIQPTRQSPEQSPGRRQLAAEQRRRERELRRAIDGREFALHYEPRYDLASGTLAGVETHIRWPYLKRGATAPTNFMALAEQTGLVTRLGGWMLDEACAAAAGWPGGATLVSVPVAARQILDGALLGQVGQALERSGLHPDWLELRVTEAVLMACSVETLLTLSAIRDLGVGLALDGFGAGIASLSLLRRLPLTAVKLDGSLVHGLPHGREDASVVQAVIGMGHALGAAIVAGGIRTEEQHAFLCRLGCDEGLGPLFEPPLPSDQLRALLRRRPRPGLRCAAG